MSRLVVDPERFEDDEEEYMSSRGMGVIYTKTSDGSLLRYPLSVNKREATLDKYYRPHHARLTSAVERQVENHGRALIIDCHSFPSEPLRYEISQSPDRPQVCIGTDDFHTPRWLTQAAYAGFKTRGFSVELNRPFAGALVPLKYWHKDTVVSSFMVEVRRDLYMDETTGERLPGFDELTGRITESINAVIDRYIFHAGK